MSRPSTSEARRAFRLAATLATAPALGQVSDFQYQPDKEASYYARLSLEELLDLKVVTGTKRPQSAREVPATIEVVTGRDIRRLGYRDLKDVLQHTLGVEFGYPYSWLQGGQRGFAGSWSQTKLLIDGREANLLWSGEAFISNQFLLNHVKQIEIIHGPASSLYGADAFVGVINIITKKAGDVPPGTELLTAIDTLGARQAGISSVHGNEVLGASVSAAFTEQRGPDFGSFVQSPQFSDVNRALRNQIDARGLDPYRDANAGQLATADVWYAFHHGHRVEAGLVYFQNEDGGGQENAELSFTNFNDLRRQFHAYARYMHDFKAWAPLPLKLQFDYQFVNESDLIRFQDRGGSVYPTLAVFNIENSRLHNASLQLSLDLAGIGNYLVVGAAFRALDIGEPAFTGTDPAVPPAGFDGPLSGHYLFPPTGAFSSLAPYLMQRNVAVFLQDQQQLFSDRLQLIFGARYDDESTYGDALNFRSGLYARLTPRVAVKGLFGEAFRRPTVFELSSNDALRPARIRTAELALQVEPLKQLYAEVLGYTNRATGIIEQNRGADPDRGEDAQVNRGRKRVWGLEGRVRLQVGRAEAYLGITHVRDPDDAALTNVAPVKVNAHIVYRLHRLLSLSLQGKYAARINTQILGADGVTSPDSVTPFRLLNSTLSFGDWALPGTPARLRVDASVYNLFNWRNFYPNVRGPNPYRFLAEGRSFRLQVGLLF